MQATEQLAPEAGIAPVCDALGISRARQENKEGYAARQRDD